MRALRECSTSSGDAQQLCLLTCESFSCAAMGTAVPISHMLQMVYFLKDTDHFVTRHNISQLVQFGVLKDSSSGEVSSSRASYRGSSSGASNGKSSSSTTGAGSIASSMEPLLRLMGNVYLPQVAHSGSWPDAVRKDFLSYTHRFMSSLTEAVHEAQGRTVLYMPAEELNNVSANNAARDKHLIQRLETTLMYWTRQIANVLNKQDCCDMGQRAGPLVEIEFWRSRSQDLNGISAQLEDKQVRGMCAGRARRHSKCLQAKQRGAGFACRTC